MASTTVRKAKDLLKPRAREYYSATSPPVHPCLIYTVPWLAPHAGSLGVSPPTASGFILPHLLLLLLLLFLILLRLSPPRPPRLKGAYLNPIQKATASPLSALTNWY
jgi:hypothetical protein